MKTPTDLHPDDTATRDRIAAQLRAARVEAGLSQQQLGDRLGVTKSNIAAAELSRAWRVALMQARARALGLRLTVAVDGLTVPDDGDPIAAMYAHQCPVFADAQDRLMLRTVVNDLARIRRARMTAAYMAALLDRSESSAFAFENNPDGALLVTVQRFTRALGGVLTVGLHPAAVFEAVV